MVGIEKISARLEAEAIADAARLAEETRGKCDSLRDEAEKKAQELYWQCIREGTRKTEERVQLLAKTANMEARKSLLNCRQSIVDEAFRKAETRLRELPEGGYVAFLVDQVLKAAETGREELILSASDLAVYGSAILSKANTALAALGRTAALTLSEQPGDFSGGFMLKNGSIAVNCTLESLMAQARQEQTAQVVAELFS